MAQTKNNIVVIIFTENFDNIGFMINASNNSSNGCLNPRYVTKTAMVK